MVWRHVRESVDSWLPQGRRCPNMGGNEADHLREVWLEWGQIAVSAFRNDKKLGSWSQRGELMGILNGNDVILLPMHEQ